MQSEGTLKEFLPLILVALFILWDFTKNVLKDKDTDLKDNTRALIVATHQIEVLNEKVASLSKLPRDVQNLSTKIKVIETKLEN